MIGIGWQSDSSRLAYDIMRWILLSFFSLFLLVIACSNQQDDRGPSDLAREARRLSRIYPLPASVKFPADNHWSEAKVHLGRLLFFDPILSGKQDIACATCHHPDNGFAESRDLSIGTNGIGFGNSRHFKQPNEIPLVKRNAHTILNTAFNGIDLGQRYDPNNAPMFWDNRANSLEEQALMPMKALEEMRGTEISEEEIVQVVIKRLRTIDAYVELFEKAFPDSDQPIDSINLAKALATYERTLVNNNTRFDMFKRGEAEAMSLGEKEGMQLFIEVGCAACHNGPMLSDYKTHVLGVPENDKLTELDRGFEDRFHFRTPTLRNLRFTFPFMHNGTMHSIREILEFYQDISQGKSRNPNVPIDSIDPLARALKLKVKDFGPIENFLLSLNDDNYDRRIPAEVPSGLPVGGNISSR